VGAARHRTVGQTFLSVGGYICSRARHGGSSTHTPFQRILVSTARLSKREGEAPAEPQCAMGKGNNPRLRRSVALPKPAQRRGNLIWWQTVQTEIASLTFAMTREGGNEGGGESREREGVRAGSTKCT